ncbi:hypothetical protein JCM16303_000783 [Sporobolomyces ruberrimus]
MFTASLPRRPSQINVVEDLDSQVEEAGELARSQVDEEIKQANKDVKELLEKIVDGAVRHGDDRKIMEEWADRLLTQVTRESKTAMIVETEKFKVKEKYVPGDNFFHREVSSWRKEEQHCLATLSIATGEAQRSEIKISRWFAVVNEAIGKYFQDNSSSSTAGMQIKYEVARLNLLIKGCVKSGLHPVSLMSSGDITRCYSKRAILERLGAWRVNSIAHSSAKRSIGKRVAQIEGVPHFENANGETCF